MYLRDTMACEQCKACPVNPNKGFMGLWVSVFFMQREIVRNHPLVKRWWRALGTGRAEPWSQKGSLARCTVAFRIMRSKAVCPLNCCFLTKKWKWEEGSMEERTDSSQMLCVLMACNLIIFSKDETCPLALASIGMVNFIYLPPSNAHVCPCLHVWGAKMRREPQRTNKRAKQHIKEEGQKLNTLSCKNPKLTWRIKWSHWKGE